MQFRLADVGLLLALAMVALSGVLPPAAVYAVALVAAPLLGLALKNDPFIRPGGAKVATILFVWGLSAICSAWVGGLSQVYPADSYVAAFRLCLPFVMFLYGYRFGGNRLVLALSGFAWIGAFHSFWSLTQLISGTATIVGGVSRAAGALTPNVLSNLLGMCLICSTLLASGRFTPGQPKRRYFILSGLIFAGMLGSGTLKNILVSVVVLIAIYLSDNTGRMVARTTTTLLLALIVIPASLVSERVGGRLKDATDVLGYIAPDDDGRPSSLLWRLRHWEHLIADWRENFLWLGSGVGQSPNMAGIRSSIGQGATAHGDWVAVLVEGGVVFGIVWLAISAAIFTTIVKAEMPTSCKKLVLALSVYFALIMFTGNVVFTSAFLFGYWLIVGAAFSFSTNGKRLSHGWPGCA